MRLLEGERLYRDFLQFTQPPGLDLVFLSLFKRFGPQMWVTNLVVLVLGLAFVWLIFSIARRFMRREAAVLAAAIFLVPIYGNALNATHHWFGVLVVLVAVRVMLGGVSALRIALSGAILGLASCFSLYHGLAGLLAFSGFLLWHSTRTESRWADLLRRQVLLIGAYVAALAVLYTPYLMRGGKIAQLWYFQVTCVRKYAIDEFHGVRLVFPLPFRLHNLPALSNYLAVYLLLAVATAAALYLCWKRRSQYASITSAMLVLLVAIVLLAEVTVSPNWLRIYAVSSPTVILLAWAIEQWPGMRLCASIALWAWVLILGAHQTITRHKMQRTFIDLPAGRVATTPQMAAKLTTLLQFVKPGDDLFQAGWPGVYVPLHVRNPTAFETTVVSDMPRPGDVELVTRQLAERRVPYVLWEQVLDSSCSSPCNDRLTPLRDYIHAAYVPVATTPDGDTLWRRRQ